MTEQEYREKMYMGNYYKCGFCGKEELDRPIYTLSICKGMAVRDIADICPECIKRIEEKVRR